MPLKIVHSDITKMNVDAVVNAANTSLKMGGGVCGAIFSAAGAKELQAECDKIGSCQTGKAVITKAYGLPSKYIIHTAGPVWRGGGSGEETLLLSCYTESLKLALKHKCSSVAFPLISSGIYGYPKKAALKTAIRAIGGFLDDNGMMVYLVIYDKEPINIDGKLLSSIENYTDNKL